MHRSLTKRLPDVDYQHIQVRFQVVVGRSEKGKSLPLITVPTTYVFSDIDERCRVDVPITAEMRCGSSIFFRVIIQEVTSLLESRLIPSFLDMDWELSREDHSAPIGIYNAGATCYLNSLIQSLFFVPKFRSLLESIPTHAIISQCLQSHSYSLLQRLLQSSTFALQKVFYLLRHSREALDIAILLDSFGWSDEEANQQVGVEDWVHSKHDVHELLVLLIEKLDREWKE